MLSFEQLGLAPALLAGVAKLGFTTPTAVQSAVIPLLLNDDRDLVALAQTGTGKTAAFGLPLLQRLIPGNRVPQALVLCPTRELCMQIARDLTQLSDAMTGVRILPVYGGADIRPQLAELKRGVQLIVATPGRMVDMLRRHAVDLSAIRCVVLDEADEMFTMGFEEDLSIILNAVPVEKQILLFSATMPRSVASMTRENMTRPREVTIGMRNTGPDNVIHEYYMVHARDRYPALKRIVDLIPELYGIVFCRTRQETQDIADWLMRDGYSAQALHGDLSQPQRDRVMKGFRACRFPLLVATDVAARGLDVRNLTHVINFSLPDDLDSYTHRSGRTGRAGQSGTSIVLLNLREHAKLHRVEKQLGRKFVARTVPTGDDICRARLNLWVKRWQSLEPESPLLDELMPVLCTKIGDLSREALLRKVAFLELQPLLAYYRDQPDLNPGPSSTPRKPKPAQSPARAASASVVRLPVELMLNVGTVNGITPRTLLRMIESVSPRKKLPVGRIKIAGKLSYIEVPAQQAGTLVERFNAAPLEVSGRRVQALLAKKRSQPLGDSKRGPHKGRKTKQT